MVQRFIEITCFPYGQLPRVWVPQQVTYKTYLEYVVAFYIFKGD